jgi:TonB-dependent receptor
MKLSYLSFLFLFLVSTVISAQDGTISGTINDGEFNDVLPFANVLIKGTTKGATSDFDGKYQIDLEPGTYTVVFSFLGYETKEITGVVVASGQETTVDVTLNPASNQLDEVVVTTSASQNTEASVLNLQKRSVALLDGLSIQSIKKTGANDIASAVKNVPGVSVQDGKFVYVRGLGDRYTKSILNGMDVPGLDPDRNTLQLDIFPTNILDNILVIKSSTADLPADFTGGVVDIVTKDLPTRPEYSINAGISYNRSMHFKDNYLTYSGSDTDFLGFDDGLRDLPISRDTEIPIPAQDGVTVRQLTQRFTQTMAAQQEQSFMDFNFGFTAGNQFSMNEDGDVRLGYLASLSYRNTTEFYEDYIDGQVFRKDELDPSQYELIPDRTQVGDLGINNVLWNALGGLSLKTPLSKYKLNVLHIQNGESNAALLFQENFSVNSNVNKRDVLVYTQRSITNGLINGYHTNEDASWSVEWKFAPTFSRIYDKDFRVAPFRINQNGTFTISPSESGDPTRIWRDLQEVNLPGKLDFTRNHSLFSRPAKFKVGGAYTFKNREFVVDQYSFPIQSRGGNFSLTFEGDADRILAPESIYALDTQQGTYVRRDSNISDNFDSDIIIWAGYLSEEFRLTDRFNAILGLRFEKFDLIYTGESQVRGTFDNEKILDKADFFPSANLIYDLDEDANKKLRASYSRTTARPSFKEASIAEIFDPVNSTFFIGNIDLQPTYINNFDLRFESYGEGTNFFAVSGFYKTFQDPIELSFIREARGQFTPLNLGDAKVFGAELEFRKNLGFIPGWKNFSVNTNISIIESQQNFSDDEREAREDNLREGETLGDFRQLQGQSPYLINFGFDYDNPENGWQAGLFYNVQGETLEIVGNGDIPDVFTQPFHNLRLNVSKSFGKEQQNKISLRFQNILNDDIESFYKSFRATNEIFSSRYPGQAISLSYSLSF